jgi:squalene-hopene/tetraprenyl-beta-curcumene cyclase
VTHRLESVEIPFSGTGELMLGTDDKEGDRNGSGGLDYTIQMAQAHLLGLQYSDGYWRGELESNPTMEAEYLLLTHFLGVADQARWRKLANHIIGRQRDDGTWGQFYDAPGDLSTTIECYFALKMAGHSPGEPIMRRAREFVLSKGGVPKARVFTKIWLALFGQWDWKGVPVLPPELILLPNWSPINIYDFASWARATIVPLLVLLDRKPVRPIPDWARIDELYPRPRSETDYSITRPKRLVGWETLFYAGDTVLRHLDKLPWKPTRGQAIRRAESWILEHQEADGSWGGIQPPWVYSLIALSSLGYPSGHHVIAKGLAGFESFAIEEAETLRIQACVSPLWDTALAMIALLDSGLPPDHPALARAGKWLIRKQVLNRGDWQVRAKGVPAGGWAFEFHNDFYPDLDDTAEIAMALDRLDLPPDSGGEPAIERAIRWTLGMQSGNGGWGAFDKDNTKGLIAKIPFADFGEAIDPPSVDVTAHILEMLGQLGYGPSHPAVAKALDYVFAEQEEDGPWFGRWGVNYIYGAGAVLPALEALGIEMSIEPVRRAVGWIVAHQNADGGWGESCASYVEPAYRGRGPSTPSQTAWALIALLSAGESAHPATQRGLEHLIRTQRDDDTWDEPYFTGTGFPGYGVGQRLRRYLTPDEDGYQGTGLPTGFMINYHMYRNYWPLMALGRYRRHLERGSQPAHMVGGMEVQVSSPG